MVGIKQIAFFTNNIYILYFLMQKKKNCIVKIIVEKYFSIFLIIYYTYSILYLYSIINIFRLL